MPTLLVFFSRDEASCACLRSIGIAFSGAVGVGLFQTSGQVIAMGGPVGALLAFLIAGGLYSRSQDTPVGSISLVARHVLRQNCFKTFLRTHFSS